MDEARLDAYCGLYCGACEILAAYRRGKERGQKPQWEDLPEQIKGKIPRAEIICQGCRADEVFAGCRDCRVRECAREREVTACFFCRDYPCSLTEELRKLAEGARERLPHVTGIFGDGATAEDEGYDAWAEALRARWSCPSCGAPFTWYQERCSVCRLELTGLKGYPIKTTSNNTTQRADMFPELEKILYQAQADYADVRYEMMSETAITFSGKELTGVSANNTDGYVVRVLKRGGLASVAFTRAEEAENAVRTAVENAVLYSKNSKNPVKLAETDQMSGSFHPELAEDPSKMEMREKLELLSKYNDIPLSSPKVVNTNMGYSEVRRIKYFANTEGSRVQETLITTGIRGLITAKDGNLTQNIRVAVGGSDGFGKVRGQEKLFEEQTKLAVDLLSAQPVSSGVYRCIINPDLAGVFAHEAFGHFSEADIVETLPAMRQKMQLGARLGAETINIIDDATRPGQLGFYRYDDEGVAVRPVQLIKDGVLVGRLHSRRTAAEFGEPVTGHCVAEDYRYAPIVRMGTIFIQPGNRGFGELLQEVGDGLYLLDAKGGQTAGENFTFGANYGYLVKGGKIGPMIRDINISGNLYQTLMDIGAVGDDLELCRTGGCGKGQTNIRSCHGGPHIVIDNLVVGGA